MNIKPLREKTKITKMSTHLSRIPELEAKSSISFEYFQNCRGPSLLFSSGFGISSISRSCHRHYEASVPNWRTLNDNLSLITRVSILMWIVPFCRVGVMCLMCVGLRTSLFFSTVTVFHWIQHYFGKYEIARVEREQPMYHFCCYYNLFIVFFSPVSMGTPPCQSWAPRKIR